MLKKPIFFTHAFSIFLFELMKSHALSVITHLAMRNMKFHGSKTEKMEHLQKSDITFETDFS